MKKILFLVLFSFVSVCYIFGFGSEVHNSKLENVLFGKNLGVELLSEKGEKNLNLLEYASYLCLDYYNNEEIGKNALLMLSEAGVLGLPVSTEEIDFPSNQHHQMYTHKGWNFSYVNDRAHWGKRKDILVNTVNLIGDFEPDEHIKIEAFAALVYYIHIIEDHEGDSGMTRVDRIPLTYEEGYDKKNKSTDNQSNPTVISELIYYLGRLFREQNRSRDYRSLLSFLNANKSRFAEKHIEKNEEGHEIVVYTKYEESQRKYFAKKLHSKLEEYIPSLLKNENFFERAFMDAKI